MKFSKIIEQKGYKESIWKVQQVIRIQRARKKVSMVSIQMLISRYSKCWHSTWEKISMKQSQYIPLLPAYQTLGQNGLSPGLKNQPEQHRGPEIKRMPQSLLERSQVLKWHQINPLLMKGENKCLQKSEGKLFSTLFLCLFLFNYFACVEVLGSTHVPVCLWKSGLRDLVLPPCGCRGSNSDCLDGLCTEPLCQSSVICETDSLKTIWTLGVEISPTFTIP